MTTPEKEPIPSNSEDDIAQLKANLSEIGKQLKSSGIIIARQIRAEVDKAREELSEKANDNNAAEEVAEEDILIDSLINEEKTSCAQNTCLEHDSSDPENCSECIDDEIKQIEAKLAEAKAKAAESFDTKTSPSSTDNQSSSRSPKGGKKKATKKQEQLPILIGLVAVIALILFANLMSSCSPSPQKGATESDASLEADSEISPEPIGEICNVSLTLEVEENVLFSKYDVRVEVDGAPLGTVQHGTQKNFDIELTEGYHDLLLYKPDDRDVTGEMQIEVIKDMPIHLVATCDSTGISIDQLSEEEIDDIYAEKLEQAANQPGKTAETVIKQLEKLGYKDNGYTLSCFENGKQLNDFDSTDFDVSEGSVDVSDRAIKLVLISNIPIEVSYPKETAQRAVLVAITNCYATDVFSDDGSSYDESKFHTYADMTGNYLTMEDAGEWEPVDKTTWHVDNMQLKKAGDKLYYRVTADVMADGERYKVDNVTVKYANSLSDIESDSSSVGAEELTATEDTPYLFVGTSLISDDRDLEAEQAASEEETSARAEEASYNDWLESQFSWWDGNNDDFVDLVKDRLHDERSFKDAETSYIVCRDQESLDLVNSALSAVGGAPANMNDVYITMDFSAKNGYNARIKQQAHGIIRHPSGNVELLAII